MIEGNYDREMEPGFVSGEEIRELLRDDAGEPADDVSSAPRRAALAPGRVLAILRRGPQCDWISERLAAGGLDVTVLRNPFNALDQLRRDAYDAVVSDMDLWANCGALLLERLRDPERKVPVLFVASAEGGPRDRVEAHALRQGAWKVLFKPLDAATLEKAVLDLREECLQRSRRPPGTATALQSSGEPFGPADAELAWLRFFFHASMASRDEGTFEACAGKLLAAAMEQLRPRAAGVFFSVGGFPRALLSRPGAEPDETMRLLLEVARGDGPEGALRVSLGCDPGGAERQLVLLCPPGAVLAAAGPFLEALGALFRR